MAAKTSVINKLKYSLPDSFQAGRMVIAIILTAVVTLGFITLSLLRRIPEIAIPIENGVIDLIPVDFGAAVVSLPLDWEYYPGVLLNPDDFNNEYIAIPPEDVQIGQMGTYRTVLRIKPGEVYAMNAWSLDYATRIFTDGIEVLNVGTAAADADDFEPRVKKYVLPVIPRTDSVEIIIQYADHIHYNGGAMRKIVFGLSDKVNDYAQDIYGLSIMLGGAMLLVAIFNPVLFVGGHGFSNLAFALTCFFFAERNQQFFLSMMPSEIPWGISYRLMHIDNICCVLVLLLLIYSMYPSLLPRRAAISTMAGSAAAASGLTIAVFSLPISMAARLIRPSYLIIVPAVVCICWASGKLFIIGRIIDRIMAAGFAVLIITLSLDILFQRPTPDVTRNGLGLFGVLAFVACEIFAFGLENTELERLNKLKIEFLQNMSHELRTPLTVISTDILNASDQLDFEMDKEDMRESLENAQREIMRMARMIDRAIEISTGQTSNNEHMEPLDIAAVLHGCAETYRPILERRGNSMRLEIPESLPAVRGNEDMLFQVLSNLLSNANRHTKNGEIAICATMADGVITVTVHDTGEGINPVYLPHIFERGVSLYGTGYGLPICKSIVEAHQGKISIKSEYAKGTAVTFTLAVYQEPEVERL